MNWHKDSRFWRIAPYFPILAMFYDFYFKEPVAFLAVTLAFLTGAGGKTVVDQYNQGRTFPEDDRGAG